MVDNVNGKLDDILEAVGNNTEELENITSLLIGDTKDSNKVGLVSRVKKLEDWYSEIKDDLKWIKRSFAGGLLAIAIGVIVYIIQNQLP